VLVKFVSRLIPGIHFIPSSGYNLRYKILKNQKQLAFIETAFIEWLKTDHLLFLDIFKLLKILKVLAMDCEMKKPLPGAGV
jgi:hypothetical protein